MIPGFIFPSTAGPTLYTLSGAYEDFNLYDYLEEQRGAAFTDPVNVLISIAENAIFTQSAYDKFCFTTAGLPAGSFVLLYNLGRIHGLGGYGGSPMGACSVQSSYASIWDDHCSKWHNMGGGGGGGRGHVVAAGLGHGGYSIAFWSRRKNYIDPPAPDLKKSKGSGYTWSNEGDFSDTGTYGDPLPQPGQPKRIKGSEFYGPKDSDFDDIWPLDEMPAYKGGFIDTGDIYYSTRGEGPPEHPPTEGAGVIQFSDLSNTNMMHIPNYDEWQPNASGGKGGNCIENTVLMFIHNEGEILAGGGGGAGGYGAGAYYDDAGIYTWKGNTNQLPLDNGTGKERMIGGAGGDWGEDGSYGPWFTPAMQNTILLAEIMGPGLSGDAVTVTSGSVVFSSGSDQAPYLRGTIA